MIVPNYVPNPIEIPGNVTEKPYLVRLSYIRRVESLHLVSLLLVAFVVWKGPSVSTALTLPILAGGLLVLALLRVALRGSVSEWVISGAVLLPVLGVLGLLLGELQRQGLPVWAPGIGALGAFAYSCLCGRDHSFVGQWVLTLIASSLAIAGMTNYYKLPPESGLQALLFNGAYVSFLVYDLASLLSRRRIGEEVGAVADLYRDVYNVFGYVVRVIRHWRMHKIWAIR